MPRFTETWVPFNLDDLPDGESIALSYVDGFVPYLSEKWPPAGRPHRVEMQKDGHPRPHGVDSYLVFRVPPPELDEASGTRKVTVDWSQLRPTVPPKKRKKPE
ncbi:hypothetical protein ABQF35_30240 [Mycobacterium syngnathidarum]